MIITHDHSRNFSSAVGKLEELLGHCAFHIWHVGITTNISRRQHGQPYRFLKVNGKKFSGYVQEFHLLYETDTHTEVVRAEKALIIKARSFGPFTVSGMVAGNEREGGGGRIPKHGPYYVYLALGG